MKPNSPDRSIVVKELEERLLKKWKKEKAAEKMPEKASDPQKPVSTPPAKKS